MKSAGKLSPLLFLVSVLLLWQIVYELGVFPAIMFPSLADVGAALVKGFFQQDLGLSVVYTLTQIAKGLALGIGLALVVSVFSILCPTFCAIYNMLNACFNPLPGIAVLPLAILWFGVGEAAVIFVIVHAVLWPMSQNTINGFMAVPPIHIEVGRNIGLRHIRLVLGVYVPSSAPYLISGFKICWGRAWRAVIGAEMIFGAAGAVGGVGWYIFKQRYMLDTAGVFAALLVIIAIGLLVEYGAFSIIERRTVRKWGISKV